MSALPPYSTYRTDSKVSQFGNGREIHERVGPPRRLFPKSRKKRRNRPTSSFCLRIKDGLLEIDTREASMPDKLPRLPWRGTGGHFPVPGSTFPQSSGRHTDMTRCPAWTDAAGNGRLILDNFSFYLQLTLVSHVVCLLSLFYYSK